MPQSFGPEQTPENPTPLQEREVDQHSGRLELFQDSLAEKARRALLIGSTSLAALAGGVVLAYELSKVSVVDSAQGAPKQSPPSTGITEQATSVSPPSTTTTTTTTNGKINGNFDRKNDNDSLELNCQHDAIGYFPGTAGLVSSKRIAYRRGGSGHRKETVEIDLGIRRPDVWDGNVWLYNCSDMTKNEVRAQLVRGVKQHKHNGSTVVAPKPIGRATMLHGDQSTAFDGIQEKVVQTGQVIPIPARYWLTDKAIKNHAIGIELVDVSTPLRHLPPYIDPQFPKADVRGPMKPLKSKPHIFWIKRSEVAH